MENTVIAASPLDIPVMPVAWLHDQHERYDVVHDKAKALWLKAWPKQIEHYTIPLYDQSALDKAADEILRLREEGEKWRALAEANAKVLGASIRQEERQPLSTETACALLKDALGIDPMLDGNMLKMLRAVERAHGIGHNAEISRPREAG